MTTKGRGRATEGEGRNDEWERRDNRVKKKGELVISRPKHRTIRKAQ